MALPQPSLTKYEELAGLISVDPARLEPLSEATCTRLINALRQDSYFITRYGLNFYALRRTQNIGIKSATELCRCLDIPTSYKAWKSPIVQPVRDDRGDVAACLVNMIHEKNSGHRIVRHVLYSVGSPDLVITNHEGKRFRVSVEKL